MPDINSPEADAFGSDKSQDSYYESLLNMKKTDPETQPDLVY